MEASLRGGQGDDTINGGAGNDILSGDKGIDELTGGAGGDMFLFGKGDAAYSGSQSAGYFMDKITDFEMGVDKLDVGAGYTQLVTLSAASIETAIQSAQLQT